MISYVQTVSSLQSLLTRQRTTTDMTRLMMIAEEEVATGRHADPFSALGTRAVEAMNTRAVYERTEGRIESNTLLQNRLDLMATALGNVRDAAQDVLTMTISNTDPTSSRQLYLKDLAQDAYDSIVSFMNASYNGKALFGGVDSDRTAMNSWAERDAATGLSASDVMSTIVGGGITDAADANAKLAEIDAVFNGTPANPAWGYEATFFNGTPLEDGLGNANPRLAASIDENLDIGYGVQANDRGFRDMMRGLAMLAAGDPATITDDGAYEAWVGEAAAALGAGVTGVLNAEARTGSMQKLVEDSNDRLHAKREVLTLHISELESVDPFEAASRLTSTQTQLQASYAVTARLSQLSFVNFMR
ncbi:flagellar hook-associated protein [Pseudooceanicola batsensis HTCC2597]|uniref:Flagellin n=1 Tax=Pseudooceanicola batsensis (strain ATCC BAA-863 / DSM 15984 / KCTC 12145 / HTCC2597) TaxID=252305 RepID=A3U100_PSEBH|nr:flagellin [Pseudooceanicola batsensis]EAQ01983.1 flagellar hook-associated protein [Pseudooceanicola batsensis HTCC2597]